jgi:hypothetical protein
MSDTLARLALGAAPPFPHRGRWTPCTYTHDQRAAAAADIANAIRHGAHMLTTDERERLADELLSGRSCDHPHNPTYGEPA